MRLSMRLIATLSLMALPITEHASYEKLAEVRGFDLINDATNYANKKNMMQSSIINLSTIRSNIQQHGYASARDSLLTSWSAYYHESPHASLQEIRTTLKEEIAKLATIAQHLHVQLLSNSIGPSDDETYQTLHDMLKEIGQDLHTLQHNLPSPLTLERALQAGIHLKCQADIVSRIVDNRATQVPDIPEAPDTTHTKVSIENVLHSMCSTADTICRLEPEVQNIHLGWYNSAYRGVCNVCNALPMKKLAIGGGITAGAGILALYATPDEWGNSKHDTASSSTASLKETLHALKWRVFGPQYQLSNEELERIKNTLSDPYNPNSGTISNVNPRQQQAYNYVQQCLQQEDPADLPSDMGTYIDQKLNHSQSGFESLSNLLNNKMTKFGGVFMFLDGTKQLTKILKEARGFWAPIRDTILSWHERLKGAPSELFHQEQFGDYKTLDDPRFDAIRNDLGPIELIRQYMNNPHDFAQGDINIPSTVLITGPSGCGKSFIIDALANSIKEEQGTHRVLNFEKSHAIMAMMEGADNSARALIEKAKSIAPCVIVMDEIHHCGLQRNSDSNFLSELLREIDHLDLNRDPEQQVFIVAATNDPQYLDQALMRDGRFTRISLSYPGFEQRKSILHTMCEQAAIETCDIDFDYLASITASTPLSTLEKVFERATTLARRNNETVSLEHFYIAINTVARKINAECTLSQHEKENIAAYMAAQATLEYVHNKEALDAVTICPYNANIKEENAVFHNSQFNATHSEKRDDKNNSVHKKHGRIFYVHAHEQFDAHDTQTRRERCKRTLAGRIGERMLTGREMACTSDDAINVYDEVCNIVCDDIPLEKMSQQRQNEKCEEAHKLYEQLKQEASQELTEHTQLLNDIYGKLLQEYFVHRQHIDQLEHKTKEAQEAYSSA